MIDGSGTVAEALTGFRREPLKPLLLQTYLHGESWLAYVQWVWNKGFRSDGGSSGLVHLLRCRASTLANDKDLEALYFPQQNRILRFETERHQ
jgi:hypothetical protein